MSRHAGWAVVLLAGAIGAVIAIAEDAGAPYSPATRPASDDGVQAIDRMTLPKDMRIELFAAEPRLVNPVALAFDGRGRCFIAEGNRLHNGVTDARRHMYWLEDDLASRVVAHRDDLYRKWLKDKFPTYAVDHDRVRMLDDVDGDGKADRDTVFADGFHAPVDGLGSGVLARGKDVWFTCIPNLWHLRDEDGDGVAEIKKSLSTGYGVHVGYSGHDLHGLRFGPDGRLYFSIGDRGLNVVTAEGGTLFYPDTGCVLRCEPDGSELEVFASGLRNPQELAFDDAGNLFTGDNNSDGGDQARFVYLVEGSDSGWRIGYQFHTWPTNRGPWNAEKLWYPAWDGQAAYILPPIANVGSGPSGLTYYPGVGLNERYRGHFFLCDYRGAAGLSGTRALTVGMHGAGFELTSEAKFVWNICATDIDFGPGPGVYIADWVEGWETTGKGRVYRVFDPALEKDPAVLEVRELLRAGMDGRPDEDLLRLLGHADQRIRQEAQFTLAAKGDAAVAPLQKIAQTSDNALARRHAIWGLGQISRKKPEVVLPLIPLLRDRDLEVRCQTARVLGEAHPAAAFDSLAQLLHDKEPRARFFAALAMRRYRIEDVMEPIAKMLEANNDEDRFLRHAGVMALASVPKSQALAPYADSQSRAVRMGVLLAYRQFQTPEIARFLHDPEISLVVEAARAINDVPIEPALPALARLIDAPQAPTELITRALNANFRVGTPVQAAALAEYATRSRAPLRMRCEALELLSQWPAPPPRDRIVGLYRPLESRPAEPAAKAVFPYMDALLADPSDRIQRLAASVVGALDIHDAAPALVALYANPKSAAVARAEALRSLGLLKDDRLGDAVKSAVNDSSETVRTEGRRLLAQLKPAEALPILEAALGTGSITERQASFATLATVMDPGADAILSRWLTKVEKGEAPAELALDVLDAVAQRESPDLRAQLDRLESALPKDDPLAAFRATLVGGDAETGKKIFFERSEASCLRCHRVKGVGGDVGPDLSDIGARVARDYILESLIDPSRKIAKGFDTVVVATDDGETLTGVLRAEDDKELRLVSAEGKTFVVEKSKIENRRSGPSAMPDNVVKNLKKREIRDLIQYLSTLKP